MHHVAESAPEIDRLVWTVNRWAEAKDGPSIERAARAAGLDSPGHIDQFADWLTTIGLTRDVAVRRLPYAPEGHVDGWLDLLLSHHLLEERGGRMYAAPGLHPVAAAVLQARASVARSTWADHAPAVQRIDEVASRLAATAPAEFVVGASHRDIEDLGDTFLTFHRRLVTLRYLRQHAHVEAWRDAGLATAEATALTALWLGDPPGPGLEAIEARGLAHAGRLSPEGLDLRIRIEADTNRRMVPLFSHLTGHEADRFLGDLTSLPGTPPS